MSASRLPARLRCLLVAVSALGLLLISGVPAQAVPGPVGATPRTGPNTDIVMSGTGPGQGVTGAYGPADFDPTADGYPASPPAGFTPLNEGFAGIITAQSVSSGDTLSMYCIDLHTSTWAGIGYENGTWNASNVPNVGYIARILDEYYPNTGEPADAPGNNARAAAVQAAIWYFSDKYVLEANDAIRPYTAAIVNGVLDDGPLAEPAPPNLVIEPTTRTGPSDSPLGPYTVTSDSNDPGLTITVRAAGGTMYADSAGTQPIADGATVANNTQVWLLPDDATSGRVTMTAEGSPVPRAETSTSTTGTHLTSTTRNGSSLPRTRKCRLRPQLPPTSSRPVRCG